MGVLEHHAQRPAEVAFFDLIDINIVIANLTILNIIETVNQVGNGRLSCTGGSDKGNLLSGIGIHFNIMQNHLVIRIAEIHTQKLHRTLQLSIGGGAFGLVIMFPGPFSGSLLRLRQAAILARFGIDQHNVSIIHLRLLIKKGKDSLGTSQGHDDEVGLLAHLVDGHIKTLIEGKEAG